MEAISEEGFWRLCKLQAEEQERIGSVVYCYRMLCFALLRLQYELRTYQVLKKERDM